MLRVTTYNMICGYYETRWLMGLWSTQAKVLGIVLKASRRCTYNYGVNIQKTVIWCTPRLKKCINEESYTVSNLLDAAFLNILVQTFKTKRSKRSFKKSTVISKNSGVPLICRIQPKNEKKKKSYLISFLLFFSIWWNVSHVACRFSLSLVLKYSKIRTNTSSGKFTIFMFTRVRWTHTQTRYDWFRGSCD